jgi:alpha-L-rhamnosidase
MSAPSPFSEARWIWTGQRFPNAYALFARTFTLPAGETKASLRVTASHHYELWVNGRFLARGPVHGDPAWMQYDELTVEADQPGQTLEFLFLVHHSDGIHLHYLLPQPAGLIACISSANKIDATDATWACLPLAMWSQDVIKRGWALDFAEDYDANREPTGWPFRFIPEAERAAWPRAVEVTDAERIWGNFSLRMVPFLERRKIEPITFRAWRAPDSGAVPMNDLSRHQDLETLHPIGGWCEFKPETLREAQANGANAFTFDLGSEYIGFYEIGLQAEGEAVVEIAGAELLRGDRPWIFRKNTSYTVRYRTRPGRQRFTSFAWSGFRYLHVVLRTGLGRVALESVACLERRLPLPQPIRPRLDDPRLQQIFDLCQRTLEVGVQEHLIDCPTREQGQYWGDAVFIAESLWTGFGRDEYLRWYLECFLHVPVREDGQISSTYPGKHVALTDYSLIPLIAQRFFHRHTGAFYKPGETLAKALQLKAWYDARLDERGLVSYDYEEHAARGMRTFIDHPGLGWHNFPHRGLDREGTSCALNLFLYGFLETAGALAEAAGKRETAAALRAEHRKLGSVLRAVFFDGTLFHDAWQNGQISDGTSWQTNSLAVYFDLVTGEEATRLMGRLMDSYDQLCRCSPYFHFYFLPALAKAGLHQEARELIKREWKPMIDAGATTTWEGFSGDEKDTLCHPWSTAPFLFLLENQTEPKS